MERLKGMVENFIEDRPTLKANNTPQRIVQLLKEEVDELSEAINGEPRENWGRELADVLFFTLTLSSQLGIDLEEEFAEKSARNVCKYPKEYFQDGDYDEARKLSVIEWKLLNGEEWFYDTT